MACCCGPAGPCNCSRMPSVSISFEFGTNFGGPGPAADDGCTVSIGQNAARATIVVPYYAPISTLGRHVWLYADNGWYVDFQWNCSGPINASLNASRSWSVGSCNFNASWTGGAARSNAFPSLPSIVDWCSLNSTATYAFRNMDMTLSHPAFYLFAWTRTYFTNIQLTV